MALRISDKNGDVYFASFVPGSRKLVFEKLVSEGKPVPNKDIESFSGNKLKIFTPHLVPSKLVLSNDISGQETPILTIEPFVLPPTIITVNVAGDGTYKITYIPAHLVAERTQWVLTKTEDFVGGIGHLGLSPVEQEQNCFIGNNLEFSPGEDGCERVTLSRNAETVAIMKRATGIDFEYLL